MTNPDSSSPKLILRDWLAIERTKLANERTFLAYFRTALTLLAGGVTILKLDAFQEIIWLGIVFLVLAPLVFAVGIWRFLAVRRRIEGRHYVLED